MRPQEFSLTATRTLGLLLPTTASDERVRGLLVLPAELSLTTTVVRWTQATNGDISFPSGNLHPVLEQGLAAVLKERLPTRASELPEAPPLWGWLENNLLFLEDGLIISPSRVKGDYTTHALSRRDGKVPEADAWIELKAAGLGERETRYSPALAFWEAINAWTADQEENGRSARNRLALEYVGQAMYRTVPL